MSASRAYIKPRLPVYFQATRKVLPSPDGRNVAYVASTASPAQNPLCGFAPWIHSGGTEARIPFWSDGGICFFSV
jgi:hypothetical protein